MDEWDWGGEVGKYVFENLISSEQWWKGLTTDLCNNEGFYTWPELRLELKKQKLYILWGMDFLSNYRNFNFPAIFVGYKALSWTSECSVWFGFAPNNWCAGNL